MALSPRSRRALLRLGACGLASVLAGCGTDTDGTETDGTETDGTETATTDEYDYPMVTVTGTQETEPPHGPTTAGGPTPVERTLAMGETATSRDGVSVTVSDARVRKIVHTFDVGSGTHPSPAGWVDSQFLTLAVDAEGRDLAALALAPVLDGQRHDGETYRHDYDPGGSGTLSLRVPVTDADRAAVEWRPTDDERYRWTVRDAALGRLGQSPAFAVTEWSVPDAIDRGQPFTASLTVENTGDRDGRFLAEVRRGGSSSVPFVSAFTMSVPVGETVTKDLSGSEVEKDDESATAIFDWGLGERETAFDVTE